MTLPLVFSTQLQYISFYNHSENNSPNVKYQHVDLCLSQRGTVPPQPQSHPPNTKKPLFTTRDVSLFYVATFAYQIMFFFWLRIALL